MSAAIDICERRKELSLETWLLYIDFKKAYNLASHIILFEKMEEKCIGPRFIESIQSLYRGTKLKVRVENVFSQQFNYNRGVRQGCPTSPILFDIFIDDLLDGIKGIIIPYYKGIIPGFCFADDTLILGGSIEDIQNKCLHLE